MLMSLDFAECERARVARDPSYDGRFFTGVRTTGIYCSFFRPQRRPKRRDFGLVCDAAPRPRHFPMPGSEAAQPSSVQYGLLSRRALLMRRERRSKNLPSASVWGAANWLACSPGA
jgi:AraC family transcriptional regulator of adaptative response / DNA-3-methyladenine glycosylase II